MGILSHSQISYIMIVNRNCHYKKDGTYPRRRDKPHYGLRFPVNLSPIQVCLIPSLKEQHDDAYYGDNRQQNLENGHDGRVHVGKSCVGNCDQCSRHDYSSYKEANGHPNNLPGKTLAGTVLLQPLPERHYFCNSWTII